MNERSHRPTAFACRMAALAAAVILHPPSTAQDVYSSVSGPRAALSVSGDRRHVHEFWLRPGPGADSSSVEVYDAGLGGPADVVAGPPSTVTIFELLPFDSVFASPQPLVRRPGTSSPSARLDALAETRFVQRWARLAQVSARPNGWIVRVRIEDGDDINTFKIAARNARGEPAAGWEVLSFDLSVCLVDIDPGSEAQFIPDDPSSTDLSGIAPAGHEDSNVLIKDGFGNSVAAGSGRDLPDVMHGGVPLHRGVAISGSAYRLNNLTVTGPDGPILWVMRPMIVERPVPPRMSVEASSAGGCTGVLLRFRSAGGSGGGYGPPQWYAAGSTAHGDSLLVDFRSDGEHDVVVLLPTDGVLFPRFWVHRSQVRIHPSPSAVILPDRTIASPDEVVELRGASSRDPSGRPLGYRWFVNDEFRGSRPTLRLASLPPGTYSIRLVVAAASGLGCLESSAMATVRVNDRPYAEIAVPEIIAPDVTVNAEAATAIDSDRDALTFSWSGPGVAGDTNGRTVALRHDTPGTYEIALTVDDGSGASNAATVVRRSYRVNAPPRPAFEAPLRVAPGDPIVLTAKGSADRESERLSFDWMLSDGRTFDGVEARFTLDTPGDHSVALSVDDGDGVPNSRMQLKKVISVSAPVVPAISAAGRSTASRQRFSADGTVVPDSRTVSYAWTFGDGSSGTGPNVEHVYARPGSYTVRLTTNDARGLSNSVRTIEHTMIIDQYPEARFNAPERWEPGVPLSLDGTASSDADGSITAYEWSLNGRVFSRDARTEIVFPASGEHAVMLRVRDASGFPDAMGVLTRRVRVNAAPIAVVSIEPAVAEPEERIRFDASASSDPDGSAGLTARWSFSDGVELEGLRVVRTFPAPGSYAYTCTIDDGSGFGNARVARSSVMSVNAPPVIVTNTAIRLNTGRVPLNAGESYDPDGDAIEFTWTLPDGTVRNDAAFTWVAPSGGAHFLSLTADDGRGKKNSVARQTVRIIVNRPPVPVVDSSLATCTGRQVVFNGSRSFDPDGDPLSAIWEFGDGHRAEALNAVHSYDRPGVYLARLSVRDDFSPDALVATFPVHVEGSPVAVQAFRDTVVCVNTPLVFDGTRSRDPGGMVGSYLWDFGDGSGAAGPQASHAYAEPGEYAVTLTVAGTGSGRCPNTARTGSRVIVVQGPVASFSVPEVLDPGSQLALDATPSRINGTVRSARWSVRTDDTSFALDGLRATAFLARPGLYSIDLHLSVENRSDCGTSTARRVVQVNAPPSVALQAPDIIAQGDLLRADAAGSVDPDGVIVTTEWSVDGTVVGTQPVLVSGPFGPGRHELRLRVKDNSGTVSGMVERTATFMVNAPPRTSIATRGTYFAGEPVPLTLSHTEDADGDRITAIWTVGGAASDGGPIRPAPGTHLVQAVVDDGRGVSNSRDTLRTTIEVVAAPAFPATIHDRWLTGSTASLSRIGAPAATAFLLENDIRQTWIARSGSASLVLVWTPRGEALARKEYSVTILDTLRFPGSENVRTVPWNPANPRVVIEAPAVNRAAADPVSYEWRQDGQVVGSGPRIMATVGKGRNVFTVRARDIGVNGAHDAETRVVVVAEDR